MNKNQVFLSVLAKIMKETASADSPDMTDFNSAYSIINGRLFNALNNSRYPNAPALVRRLNNNLDRMERLLLCPELVGKPVFLFVRGNTSELFSLLADCLFREPVRRIDSSAGRIPFIVYNSDSFKIEALNYANERVEISCAEYRELICGSRKNNLDLNKIVQLFIVGTPLKKPGVCYVFDNLSCMASRMLTGLTKCSILVFNPQKIFKGSGARIKYDAVLLKLEDIEKAKEDKIASKLPKVTYDGVSAYIDEHSAVPMYDFYDEIQTVIAEISVFYIKEINSLKCNIDAMRDDIVRMGDADKDLKSFQNEESHRLENTKKEYSGLSDIFSEITDIYRSIDKTLCNDHAEEKYVSPYLYEHILSRMFLYAEAEEYTDAFNCLRRMKMLKYDGSDIAGKYLDCVKSETTCNVSAFDSASCNEWGKIKCIIGMADLSTATDEQMKRWLKVLGKHISTGKEYFIAGLISEGDKSIGNFKESFSLGYYPSGDKLLDLYKRGENINLVTLSNALVPEACMIAAQENAKKVSRSNTKKGRADLRSYDMVYYKLAAAGEYLPAIAKIVNIIYEERFSEGFQIPDNDRNNPKYAAMTENGQEICKLCRYLIGKQYHVERYKEILGVILFSLNVDLSEAMRLLSGINTPIAHYCKGNMYEFGGGVSIDYSAAITQYEQAGSFGRAKKRLEAARGKKLRNERSYNNRNNYSSSSSYSSSVSSTSYSDGWCFITTAACRALNKPDNCSELNILRQFRDVYIRDSEEGKSLVTEYYRIAPDIVKKINSLPNADDEYRQLWTDYIKLSYLKIQAKEFNEAKLIYINMVKKLCSRFDIEIDKEILKYIQNLADKTY